MQFLRWAALAAVFASVPLTVASAASRPAGREAADETERTGSAVDYGTAVAPRHALLSRAFAVPALASPPGTVPNGGAAAATLGAFGPTVPWPIIPIHEIVLPDGRVMSYGSSANGQQGASLIYDVWNPALGSDPSTHMVLANTTSTDIFCSGQSMMWATGETLITGGNSTGQGFANRSINATTIFSPTTNSIRPAATMQYPRWYDSIVPLPTGDLLVLGGRVSVSNPAYTPELYDPVAGWHTLTGATSKTAFANMNYPRGFVDPNGLVYVVAIDGSQYDITVGGSGAITSVGTPVPPGDFTLPTVMFAPGKILSVRQNQVAGVIDLNGPTPTWTQTGSIDQSRLWSSGTVMADGQVLVTGGSSGANQLIGVAYQTETWNPATGIWTAGAAATHPRLYHSNALLLPDGSIVTGGGGSPGPVRNLNAEIYYPPYLYLNDGSGNPAPRPTLAAAPPAVTAASIQAGAPMALTVGPVDAISRVTFVRTGSATHGTNLDQRFVDLPFTQTGNTLAVTLSTNPNVLLPGYWMAFVWQNGTPSLAQIVLVMT